MGRYILQLSELGFMTDMLAKSLKISKLFKLILELPGRNCGLYQRVGWALSHRLEDLPEGSLVVGWSQTLVSRMALNF